MCLILWIQMARFVYHLFHFLSISSYFSTELLNIQSRLIREVDKQKTLSTHALEPNLALAFLTFIHEDAYRVPSTVARGYKRRTPGEVLFHTNMYSTFRFLQIPRGAAYALREVRRTCLNIYSIREFVGVAREMCRLPSCSSLFARCKEEFAPRRVLLETARLGLGRLVQEEEVQDLMRESEVFRREMLEMVGKMLEAYGNVWPGLTWEEMEEPRGRGRRRMIYKGEDAMVKEGGREGLSVDEESEGSEWSDL